MQTNFLPSHNTHHVESNNQCSPFQQKPSKPGLYHEAFYHQPSGLLSSDQNLLYRRIGNGFVVRHAVFNDIVNLQEPDFSFQESGHSTFICRIKDYWHGTARSGSLQRQRQKVVEIAPATTLPLETRERLFEAAVALGRAAHYRSLGTVEFLVDAERVVFIEANPRLQVEHTVTEEVTGLDLVRLQIELARGRSLAGRLAPRTRRSP